MNQKQYELIEAVPVFAEATAHLFSWSENYSFPSPASLFLDLVGYSEEYLGENLTARKMPSLGYLEIDLLSKALSEYAARPNDVYLWVEKYVNADWEEEEEN